MWSFWLVLFCNIVRIKELIVFWFKKSKRLVGFVVSFSVLGKSVFSGISGKGFFDIGGIFKGFCVISKLVVVCFLNSRRRLVGKSMSSEIVVGLLRRFMMFAY